MAIYLFPFWGLARANGGKVGTGCFAFCCQRLKLEDAEVFDQQWGVYPQEEVMPEKRLLKLRTIR
jgi:hypothetical protein